MTLGKSDSRTRISAGSTERAVSPVIGVILMVAITVILAAVIGVFVMGLGDDLGDSSAPTNSISFGVVDGDNITASHESGDSVEWDEIEIQFDPDDLTANTALDGTEFSVGNTVNLTENGNVSGAYEVQLIHEPSDSIIAEGEVDA